MTSGVPQGSVLGPSLFIIYINDLSSNLKSSECLLFADDAKIFKRVDSLADCSQLQSDLNRLMLWCSKWKLTLNFEKCKCINFSLKKSRNLTYYYHLGSSILKYVTEIKDRGSIFSNNFSFNMHITYIVKKAFRMLGFINRTTKPFEDVKVLNVLYNSHIRSILDYCSVIWSPYTQNNIGKLERVQKKFVKKLCFQKRVNYESTRYETICADFALSILQTRRKVFDLMFFYKILNTMINCPQLLSAIN